VLSNDEVYSATPSTGRISLRSDRSDHLELVDWCTKVIDQLKKTQGPAAPFIQTFARPIDLAGIEGKAAPTYVAVNIAALEEQLEDPAAIKLVREQGGGFVDVGRAEAALILQELGQVFSVRVTPDRTLIENGGAPVGALAFNKSRIALRSLALPLMSEIHVEALDQVGIGEPDRRPLRRYVDQEELFTILFDDLSLAYIDGSLFRDDILADGGGNFLRHIKTDARLAGAVSEKGSFAEGQPAFTADSVFAAVVDSIAAGDDILICDDLGDEWADFIGINRVSDPTSISFYHAKHGGLSLSASAFHVSVSQALKNLGRMALPADALPAKLKSWLGDDYRNDGVKTAVRRVVRGDEATLAADLDEARTAPDAVRKVYIVTSSLSKKQVAGTLKGIKEGHPPSPHFVQLYWLLSTFFSQSIEVGAFGYLVCQE
jgi:phage shock protein PspC (stress-responsive transcriptional regulator)